MILPIQAAEVIAPRAPGNSLGEAAARIDGSFADQLKRVGEVLQAGSGKLEEQPLPPQLQQLLTALERETPPEMEELSELVEAAEQWLADPENAASISPPVLAQFREVINTVTPQIEVAKGDALPVDGKPLPFAIQQLLNGKQPGNAEQATGAETPAGVMMADRSEEVDPQRPQPALGNAPFNLAEQDAVLPQSVQNTPVIKPEFAAVMENVGQQTALEQNTSFQVVQVGAANGSTNPVADAARPFASSELDAQRPQVSMNTPVGEEGWAQEMGTRLRVLVERGNQTAEIRLNPPELGSMEVKIHSDGDRTSVTFFAQNAATREALEAAMPRLREMFGDSGLQLADANVSQQRSMNSENGRDGQSGSGYAGGGSDDGVEGESVASQTIVADSRNGLVDYYI
ncbi:flagellar hook-length control protein FliK [Porticoccaceae bacterium LTM1]|nr:flagellar hook-length control protein FliK [Porticoccaceae bacterium LTM1]